MIQTYNDREDESETVEQRGERLRTERWINDYQSKIKNVVYELNQLRNELHAEIDAEDDVRRHLQDAIQALSNVWSFIQ